MKLILIENRIFHHLSFLEKVYESALKQKEMCHNSPDCALLEEVDNRGRLISIISHLQEKITEQISYLSTYENKKSREYENIKNLIMDWDNDSSILFKKIDILDQEIQEQLIKNKAMAKDELINLIAYKNKFKGYNLNSVK